MSGIKEPDLAEFLRMLRHRIGGAGVLAELAGVGRAHLSSMLHGDNARGVYTWAKIRRHVTSLEWSFLEKSSAWNAFRQLQPEIADQVRRVPTADNRADPIMPVLCAHCGHAIKVLRCTPDQGGKVSAGLCPTCFRLTMARSATAEEIERMLQQSAMADVANPAVIPLRSQEPANLALSS